MSNGKNTMRINNKQWRLPKGSQEIIKNNWVWQDYYYRLKEHALNMFQWINLPDTVDPRFIELTLFEQGLAVFFYDDLLEYLCLQCAISGRLNVYRIPIDRRAYAMNGYNKTLNIDNSVIVWNNRLHQPTEMTIRLYADRLYKFQRTIDVNLNALKHPTFIKGSQNVRLSLKNAIAKYDDNEPYIFVDDDFNTQSIEVLDTKMPFNIDRLMMSKNMVWNEAMTFLGLSNANTDKKERMVTDEVSANFQQVEQARWNMLQARKDACEEINRMFGLDIDVQFRKTGVSTKTEEELMNLNSGGDNPNVPKRSTSGSSQTGRETLEEGD